MANYNIEMQYYNGSSYDTLYPQITPDNIDGKLSASQVPNISGLNGTITNYQLPIIPVNKGGTGFESYSSGQMLYARSSNSLGRINRPSTDNCYLTFGTTGNPTWRQLSQVVANLSANGLTRIIYGSYNGTGTSGSSKPNSIFCSFVPTLLVIINGGQGLILCHDERTSSYQDDCYCLLNTSGTTSFRSRVNGNTIYWYADSASRQFNSNDTIYHYTAIGYSQ